MAEASDDHRVHEPTARRVEQARCEGRVATSRDLSVGLVALAAWLAFVVGGEAAVGGLAVLMRDALAHSADALSLRAAIGAGASGAVSALALPLLALVAVALAVGLAQTRGLVRVGPLRPDGRRIAPHLVRLWGAERLGLAAQEVGRTTVLVLVAAASIGSGGQAILALAGADAGRTLRAIFVTVKNLGLALAVAMLALGIADYLWQVSRHRKRLRMTHDEARREHKETEGEPVLKSARKRIHWELLQAHALAELSQAALVLVEPGRAAVALRYSAGIAEAPVVMAKGKGRLAERLQARAAEAGVPIVVAPVLAERLAATEEGEEIPEALHEAIAELFVELGIPGRKTVGGNQGKTEPSGSG